jgi:hypothetical protein
MLPKTLSQCIEPITRPILKTQGLAGSRIISEWSSIVGEKLAAHCIPHKLSFSAGKKIDGTLSIAVENGFATELQHKQLAILEKLATYFGYRAVARINISHTYVPEQEKSPSSTVKHILPQSCVNLAENVEDEELRAALINMAKILSGTK